MFIPTSLGVRTFCATTPGQATSLTPCTPPKPPQPPQPQLYPPCCSLDNRITHRLLSPFISRGKNARVQYRTTFLNIDFFLVTYKLLFCGRLALITVTYTSNMEYWYWIHSCVVTGLSLPDKDAKRWIYKKKGQCTLFVFTTFLLPQESHKRMTFELSFDDC
jgi:hypothetical protein